MENLKDEKYNKAVLPTDKIYDLTHLNELDDNNYVLEVIAMFLEAAPKNLFDMEQALINKDAATLYKTAHLLKGSAGVLGAEKLVKILNEIEQAVKPGVVNNNVTELLNRTHQYYSEVSVELKKFSAITA